MYVKLVFLFFSSRRRHTRCSLVTGVQTCALPIFDPRVLDLAPASAHRISVAKQRARHTVPQDAINALIVAHVKVGSIVVRLKGGDPFIFGRGGEEVEAVSAAGLPVEDRKSVGEGKSGSIRVDFGGGRIIKKKKKNDRPERTK